MPIRATEEKTDPQQESSCSEKRRQRVGRLPGLQGPLAEQPQPWRCRRVFAGNGSRHGGARPVWLRESHHPRRSNPANLVYNHFWSDANVPLAATNR